MRRRQVFHERYPASFGTFAGTVINTPAPIAEELPVSAVGQCPHCGRPLGRGGHFHIRACKQSKAPIGRHHIR